MGQFRVLMFGWELPPHNTGGLGVACYGLAQGLYRQGVEIAFALPRKLTAQIPFMKVLDHPLQGIEVTAINALLGAYMNQTNYNLSMHFFEDQSLFYSPTLYGEAERFAAIAGNWSKTEPHQLIHAHDWMTFKAGMAAKKVSGAPLVAHIHATEYDRTGGSVDSLIADAEYQGLSAADQVIAVSQYTKDKIKQFYSIPDSKITVVHNGIDPVDFSPQDIRRIFPHDQIVLYVGRLTFQKGVDHFIRTAHQLLQTHPHTIFLVVGDGDMYHKLIMDAAYMQVADRIIFTGFLQGDRLKAVYQMADVFVMPSISEPYGLVALEAIASGTPTVISKQSGVSETIKNTIKVDFWDIQKMAQEIAYLLDHQTEAQAMASAAKAELAQNTWDQAASKTLHIYQQLLS